MDSLNNRTFSIGKIVVTLSRSGHFALLPCNFDLKAHLEEFPLADYDFEDNYQKYGLNFDEDKIFYILGLLSSIPAMNKDLIRDDGFVPINAAILKEAITDYRFYLNYLIATGVLECDPACKPQEYSRGYKFCEKYNRSKPRVHRYRKSLDKNGHPKDVSSIYDKKYKQAKNENPLSNYPYLAYWYEQKKINIDHVKAEQYADLLYEKKMKLGIDNWDLNKDTGRKKDPTDQYRAILYNLEALKIHDYRALIDSNVHRLHSILTNMQKDYRSFLKYDDQQLVAVDIKNSQPYLACLLFNPEFWRENSTLTLNINTLPHNIKYPFLHKETKESLSIMLVNLIQNLSNSAFDDYRSIVASGNMYEIVTEWVENEKGIKINRTKAKTAMFQILFSSNRSNIEDENYWLTRYYKEKFPAVMRVFRKIKQTLPALKVEKQYARLACLLQAIESEIILHRCCKRIWEETKQQMPVFTVHDSIVTTCGNEGYVCAVMMEELEKCIGIAPALKCEYWSDESDDLDKDIINIIMTDLQ